MRREVSWRIDRELQAPALGMQRTATRQEAREDARFRAVAGNLALIGAFFGHDVALAQQVKSAHLPTAGSVRIIGRPERVWKFESERRSGVASPWTR
jgi:hypothetical protein